MHYVVQAERYAACSGENEQREQGSCVSSALPLWL